MAYLCCGATSNTTLNYPCAAPWGEKPQNQPARPRMGARTQPNRCTLPPYQGKLLAGTAAPGVLTYNNLTVGRSRSSGGRLGVSENGDGVLGLEGTDTTKQHRGSLRPTPSPIHTHPHLKTTCVVPYDHRPPPDGHTRGPVQAHWL